ncbi:MAG: CTP synthase (glutamine hydrolyzing) [Thermoplasmata archaeon]|nr:CTP synthase (glutamine hydrolyzing) [Thermoplasmata archaeon]
MMKYVIVTGGVLSGLGKGITTSSIGRNLQSRGLSVTAIKIDPYLNVDAGTMNPFQHGEVFVLEDGGEVDLDLGNYERFLDVQLSRDHNITTGKAYLAAIEKERHGDYLGSTVQIIPHVTDEIKRMVQEVAASTGVDVTLVEIGGTVGDIESMPFLEALRQLSIDVGKENCVFVHTTLVPILPVVGEAKTKPTQHSVKELRAVGIHPSAIVARAPHALDEEVKRKISLFCDVPVEGVVSAPDAGNIYEVPLILDEQGLTDYLLRKLALEGRSQDLEGWKALVGKYTHLQDSYISHIEAFRHAGAKANARVRIRWVESVDLEENGEGLLEGAQGILVPGGFGERGIEGKIQAIRYAREHRIPFQGVCLGFQLATIEFARNVLGLEDANSSEFDPETPYPVVDLLPEQQGVEDMGATMRLGAHEVVIGEGSKAYELYGGTPIYERHRHRYEVNPTFLAKLEGAGLRYVARSEDGRRMDILELEGHPYFLASQFHPEFKSRPLRPSPIHYGLVEAALANAA